MKSFSIEFKILKVNQNLDVANIRHATRDKLSVNFY